MDKALFKQEKKYQETINAINEQYNEKIKTLLDDMKENKLNAN